MHAGFWKGPMIDESPRLPTGAVSFHGFGYDIDFFVVDDEEHWWRELRGGHEDAASI